MTDGKTRLISPEFELNFVDDDIRQYFEEDLDRRYVARLPILLQISRQLTRLTEQLPNRKEPSGDSEGAKYEIQK